MEQPYKNDRVKDLKHITDRHESREIEGCHSWRHFAVHQDRGWLLKALGKINDQVAKVREASNQGQDDQAFESELQKLFAMFEEKALNHLGDQDG